jgi:hypothetical protein
MRLALVPFLKKRISTNPRRASKNYKKYMGSKCEFSNSSYKLISKVGLT